MADTAWVIGSEVSESFMGLCHKASALAKEQGLSLYAIIVNEYLSNTQAGMLSACGADRVLNIPLSDTDVNNESATAACLEKLAEEEPVFILFESSAFFCSVAPMLAARIDCGITADCTELSWSGERLLRLTRPAFGGKKLAHNENKKNPTLATVRKGVFGYMPEGEIPEKKAEILSCPELEKEWFCDDLRQALESKADLAGAKIIVSGGLGMGTKANYEKLYILAEKLGASVGASRAAVAAGFAGYEHQVGQTGVSVRPEIYLAFGISGAVQHLAGIGGAKYIYAVNSDPKAPIHEYSDYSVVADCVEVLDKLIDML